MECPVCSSADHVYFGSKNDYQLHECKACSFIFVSPLPTEDELNEFYTNYHKTRQYTAKIDKKLKRARRRIRRLPGRNKGKRFVDVGCNTGFAVEAARRLGLDARGIDIDSAAVSWASNYFPDADLHVAAIEDLSRNGEKFDIVYCSEVIEHVLDINSFTRALADITSDTGMLFLTTPDIGHYKIPRDKASWDGVRPPEHLYYFTKKSIKLLMKKHGFSKVRVSLNTKPTIKLIARK
jgi:predicted TPR repeat methyltransferase